jgi:hypothetical protein
MAWPSSTGRSMVQSKMKCLYITFSGKAYDRTTEKICDTGHMLGADAVRVYDDRWLNETPFRKLNSWLWETEQKFGFGWCAWKPYIIMQALKGLNTGDIVLYTDADTYPIASLSPLFDECAKEGIVLFNSQGCFNYKYTKRDCFIAMGCDEPKYWDGAHACGRFQLFMKGNPVAEQLLMEWLTYSVNPMCQEWNTSKHHPVFESGDSPDLSRIDPLDGKITLFQRNSCEQSILSLLRIKYGLPLYREACQFGWPIDAEYCKRFDIRGDYPQLFKQEYCEGDRTDLSGSSFFNAGSR